MTNQRHSTTAILSTPILLCVLVLSANVVARAEAPIGPSGTSGRIRGDLNVWAWSIAAASLEQRIPAFRAKYPSVGININMSGSSTANLRLMLTLSSGVGAPDVSQIEIANAPRYSMTGRLTDLTEVAAPYADRFVPASWANCTLNGRVYAIPWDIGPCAVFYKRPVFARYGIDPGAIETWADYIDAGKRIVERSGGKTMMLTLPASYVSAMFEILMQQNGGQVFDDQGRVAIDSGQTREVLAVLESMLTAGITSNTAVFSQAFYTSLGTEEIASFPMAAWLGGFIKNYAPETSGEWGVFPLPALTPGGLRASTAGGSVLIIPAQSMRDDAAWNFVRFMLCNEQSQLAHYRNSDLFPALHTAYDDPFFDEPDPFYGGQRVRRLFAEDITRIPQLNRTEDWREASRYISQEMSHWAANGCQETDAMLARLARQLSERLRRELAPQVPEGTP
ncbi:MAG: sugar ABC transporter substrate-binding protein [Candidatus Hydrogenedentota bacterium]